MNRFHLATSALLAGALLAAGCASPCGGCGRPSFFERRSMFRARGCCPCECCGNCGGGGYPVGTLTGGGCASCGGGCASCGGGAAVGGLGFGDGPILEPGGPPLNAVPPPAQMGGAPLPPAPLPPTLGAPSEPPSVPGTLPGSVPGAVPGAERFVPTPAPVTPANPSSRVRK